MVSAITLEDIVYIDETGIDNNLSSLYGWSLRGVKSFAEVLGHSTVRKTLIAGYCYGNKQLIAPMEYDGYTDTEVFTTWVREFLCKELRAGQVVIMDNASFHKSPRIKELIENVGCRLIYLPPYSPDLNPIEHVWANLKALIRKHKDRQDNLSLAIAECIGHLFID